MRDRGVATGNALDKNLNFSPGCLAPPQARRNHPGVVENQQVIGADEIGKLGKLVMTDAAIGTFQAQQATGAALRQRMLGYQLRRQDIAEIGTLHDKVKQIAAAGSYRTQLFAHPRT